MELDHTGPRPLNPLTVVVIDAIVGALTVWFLLNLGASLPVAMLVGWIVGGVETIGILMVAALMVPHDDR